jgi:MFS family permease
VVANLTKTFRDSFSPLRIPNFRIYLGGQAVSLIGTWLQVTAQSWVVWELSHSELKLGIVGMLSTLPILLLSPFTGVWADRLDRRKLLIGTQAGMMVLAFILAALIGLNVVQLWHVYILATLLGVLTALDMPAQQAFLGDLSGVTEVRRAVNLNAMIIQVSRMLGPAVAGIVVSKLGASIAFWLNGLSFVAVIVSLIMVKANQMRMHSGGAKSGGFVEGLRYLGTQPRLQDLFIFVGMLTFFGLSIILTMLPAFASEVLKGDAQTLGILMGASGAGALISTLIFVPLSQNVKRPAFVVALCVLWVGLWFVVMSFIHWLPLDMLSLFMGSLGGPVIFTTGLGLAQVFTPMEMRARVISVFTMISFGLQPIASLFIGWSAQTFGTPTAILVNGTLLMIGALAMLAIRGELRRWEIAPIVSAAPVEAPA